jgi:hypothetical protein
VTDDAPRWFDDDAEPPARSRRLPTLLVAAVVPWVVLAVVLLRADPAPPGSDPTLHDHDTDHDSEDPDHDSEDPDDDSGDPDDLEHGPGSEASSTLPQELHDDGSVPLEHPTRVAHGVAEALAVAITRAWLSDAGPDLDVEGVEVDRSGYLEHVAVERIVLEGDSLAVATVTVVLLDRDGDRYAGASVRRAAVPLRVTATTVHPAGQPWWLPSALDLRPQPPETATVDDEAVTAAVREALDAAGYREPEVDDLAVTDGGTLVASVTASVPDGGSVRSSVWLHLGADGRATVLGHREDDTT